MPTYTNSHLNNINGSKESNTNHYHDTNTAGSRSDTTTKTTIKHIPPLEGLEFIGPKLTYCSERRHLLGHVSSISIENKGRRSGIKMINCREKVHLRRRNNGLANCFGNSKLAFLAFASLMFIVLIYINGVHSLNCYHCSSVDNPECDEAFTGRANFTDTDCVKHIGQPAKVCRKIVQYIESKKVIIRSCGYIDEHDEKDRKAMCYKRSGTFAIMMESCNCYEDNCNHSASLVPNRSVLIALITTCTIILLYSSTANHYQHLLSGGSSKNNDIGIH